jgi:hypothetical protein
MATIDNRQRQYAMNMLKQSSVNSVQRLIDADTTRRLRPTLLEIYLKDSFEIQDEMEGKS